MMLTQETPAAPQTARRRTDWAKLFWMMKSSPLTLVGGVIIVLILLLMVLSPWITPHDPNAINLSARLLPRQPLTGLVPMKSAAICSAAFWWVANNRSLRGWSWWVSPGIGFAAGLFVWRHGRTRRCNYYANNGHYAVHSLAGADDGAGRRVGSKPV